MRRLWSFGAALALAVGLPASAPAQFIESLSNGSFENPVLPDNTSLTFTGTTTTGLPGWNVTNVELFTSGVISPSAAFQGRQFLDLDGPGPGMISQTFATTPGETYILSFSYAAHPSSSNPSAGVSVVASDLTPLIAFSVSSSASPFLNWTTARTNFVATTSSATLLFTSNSMPGSTAGILLDGVSVGVPEPGSLSLMGGAALGLLAVRRRYWRRAAVSEESP